MKIVALGPFYPYKGGIAQFTTLMSRALSKKHDVTYVSYSLQYPKILFPRGEQKDYTNDSLKLDDIKYWLNTVNPFSYILTTRRINRIKPDVIVFQWVHPFFAPAYWSICKLLSKNIRRVFISHNVLPHEKVIFQRALSKLVLRNADAIIALSKTEEKNLRTLVGDVLSKWTYLPDLLNVRMSMTIKTARRLLGLLDTDHVILFFGYVREYKGLKVLLEAFPVISKTHPNVVLIIGGEFNKSEKDEYQVLIENAASSSGRVITVGDYIPGSEIEKYFTASDIVVLPYLSATQSGIVASAYTFERPVIATNVGGLPEVVIDNETGYIVPPQDSSALADAIIRFFNEPDKARFTDNIRTELYKYSWDKLVEAIEETVEELGANNL